MGILSSVFKPVVQRANPSLLSQAYGSALPIFKPGSTLATKNTALTLSAFYNAIDILSDDIAKLPKHIFRKLETGGNEVANHYLEYLIDTRPNGKMSAFTFWKVIEMLRLIRGNAFVQIIKDPNTGLTESLHIRDNDDVKVLEDDNQLWYQYKDKLYPSSEWLHFKGFSYDGLVGVGVVTYAAKSLGVSIEAQEYGQTIYKNRGMSYGVVESDLAVKVGNKKLIEKGIQDKLASQAVHKVALLDEGFKYKRIAITPAEAQFLETNKHGILEVCRWLNIAPHLLKDLGDSNYSNIYHQSIEHVQNSVLPRVVQDEQELNYKLFTSAEIPTHYVKMNITSLLRGDLNAKAQFYTSMVYAGIYTRNEIRDLEDLNPVEGLEEPLQPVNMQALSMAQKLMQEQNNQNNGNS
jgi:HK97 family phage portal protein